MDHYDYLTRDQLIAFLRGLGTPQGGDLGQAPGSAGGIPEFGEEQRRQFEASPHPMRIAEHATRKYLAVNDAALKLYGYSREEFLALRLEDTRHPEERVEQLASFATQTGYLRRSGVRRHIRKSGEILLVEVITQDILFDGRLARLGLTVDVTGRLRMQELLWQRQQEFESLAENLPDLVARYDRDRRFLYVNSAIERAVVLDRGQIVGKTQREVGLPEEIATLYDDSVAGVFATGQPHKFEFRLALPSGDRQYEAYHVPERDAAGTIGSVLCVARDITEYKQAEIAALRSADLARLLESLARAANEALTPEAAMVACLERICRHGRWVIGRVEIFDRGRGGESQGRSIWFAPERNRFDEFIRLTESHVRRGSGHFIGRMLRERVPVWIEDWREKTGYRRWEAAARHGLRSAFAFPIIARGDIVAFMEVFSEDRRPQDPHIMGAAESLASQLARIVEREWAHQADARMAAIVESSQDAIVSRALDGTILTWNPAAERLFGYTAAEIVGRSIEMLYPPELRADMFRRQRLLMEGHALQAYETVRIAKNGRRLHVSTSPAPIRDSSGNICGVSTIIRDITERKRTEEALRESNEFLRSVIESSRDCIKVLDLEGRLLSLNVAGQRLLEIDDLSPLLNLSWLELWGDEDCAAARAAVETARNGGIGSFEGYCPTRKGSPRWWDVVVSPILDTDGRPAKLLAVSRDITRRRHTQDALREAQQRLQLVIRGGGVGLWDWNLKTGEVYFSREWKQQLGFDEHEITDRFEEWESRVHPDDRARLGDAVREFLTQPDSGYQREYRLRHRDGSYRWVLSRASAQLGADGKVERMFGCHVDVTQQKRIEEERLDYAVRQRDALVREVHHRIKNNLQGVVGLLRQKIRKSPAVTRDIEETISQLQSVALVYGLQGTRSDGLLSLAEMVEAICDSAEGLIGGRVERSFERRSPRPACVAGTEAVSIAVALNELVFNALKHQPARAVRKRAQVKLCETGDGAEILITNRGRLPKGFDYAAGRAVGNGLELVRTLLASPGGDIAFSNGRGKVQVTLKLAPPLLAERQKWLTRRGNDGGAGKEKAAAAPAGRGRRPVGAGRAG